MLEVNNLSVAFRRYDGITSRSHTVCLRDVSLSLSESEVMAIVGASGAGKSLFAHAILGVLPSNAEVHGSITLAGERLTAKRQAEVRGKAIALVPQSIAFLDPLTHIGNQIIAAARRAGVPAQERKDAAAKALARFGLDATVAGSYPHELSGGMARRVLLAVTTVGDPGLIIADEPTGALDLGNATVVLNYLRALADRGRAVLLITHDLRPALEVADRVLVVREGRAVELAAASAFRGEGKQLTSDYARALWRALPQNDFFAVAGGNGSA
jgi:peptide/nickel transport system ATP-binding protein